MSFHRGLMLVVSLYAGAFLGIPAMLPLISDAPAPLGMPAWLSPVCLAIFMMAWAKLWEDIGASDERRRREQQGGDHDK